MRNKSEPALMPALKILVQAYVKRLSELAHLINLETQLAKKTLFFMLVLSFCLCCLVLSSWFCLLVVAFFGLMVLHLSELQAALLLLLFNFILLAAVGLLIFKMKKNLTFPATRQQLTTHFFTPEGHHE